MTDLAIDFAVSDYVPRQFSDVVADLAVQANDAFAQATEEANRFLPTESTLLGEGRGGLIVELDELRVVTWNALDLAVRWHSSKGPLVIDTCFRVLPVEAGRENPVTELLLHGVFESEAARQMHPVPWVRRIVEAVGQRLTVTTGGPVKHASRHAPGALLAAELSHPGG